MSSQKPVRAIQSTSVRAATLDPLLLLVQIRRKLVIVGDGTYPLLSVQNFMYLVSYRSKQVLAGRLPYYAHLLSENSQENMYAISNPTALLVSSYVRKSLLLL